MTEEVPAASEAVPPESTSADNDSLRLQVTIDLRTAQFLFEFFHGSATVPFEILRLQPFFGSWRIYQLVAFLEVDGVQRQFCYVSSEGSSPAAFIRRIRNRRPVKEEDVRLRRIVGVDVGGTKAGSPMSIDWASARDLWDYLTREIRDCAKYARRFSEECEDNFQQAELLAIAHFAHSRAAEVPLPAEALTRPNFTLRVTAHTLTECWQFFWTEPGRKRPTLRGLLQYVSTEELHWFLHESTGERGWKSVNSYPGVRAMLRQWLGQYPVVPASIRFEAVGPNLTLDAPRAAIQVNDQGEDPVSWLLDQLMEGIERLQRLRQRLSRSAFHPPEPRRQDPQSAIEQRAREVNEYAQARLREREARREARRQAVAEADPEPAASTDSVSAPKTSAPPVSVRFDFPALAFRESTEVLTDLRSCQLREAAVQWWISNQSDDLLALPYCRIERLEYQVRAALRVIGPLRGRALLSDEVGLGKTIEAGLVLKEYLVRGMVQRFLVLTQPSLVDQWAEELSTKFGIEAATTNQPEFRSDAKAFWKEQRAVVASIHTLKQPAHLEVAGQIAWDLLVVDEAHHLRNRSSQSWLAVNALPRQFLLLLTATPVQNSLEELYNLVTLLQPGQLPTPKEFRTRFLDPKRPHVPKEPDELRRLLGQVMIRNTRANAGLKLPPRRAETALFEPSESERLAWAAWETEFRGALSQLPAAVASLWGRLLLQAAGSSPAAWRSALEKFPDSTAAARWRRELTGADSWRRKLDLIPPLASASGGVVVFTQFRATQDALQTELTAQGVPTVAIHGSIPAAERQPLTEQFRRQAGVLILTQSGTEGRNLQFCHRLVNFDLPWNPMEIEQRIGRLHRLGQEHPVRIYNFVQAGTLQEALLELLQEKLNLFELVVGETGLILGERYGGEEFAEEVLRRWREATGDLAGTFRELGEELAQARDGYRQMQELDQTLFAQDYADL